MTYRDCNDDCIYWLYIYTIFFKTIIEKINENGNVIKIKALIFRDRNVYSILFYVNLFRYLNMDRKDVDFKSDLYPYNILLNVTGFKP